MVFASLLEYAAVSYLNKKLAQRREKRRKKAEEEQVPLIQQLIVVSAQFFTNDFRERCNTVVELQSKPVEYPMFSSSSKPTPIHTAINSPLIQSVTHFSCYLSSCVAVIGRCDKQERSGALVPMLGRYSPVRMMHVPGSPCGLSDHQLECDCDLTQSGAKNKRSLWPAPFGKAKRPRRTKKFACTPSKIDKYSRAVFPLLFLGFNSASVAPFWPST